MLYVWLSAREANLSYNESAIEAGQHTIDRPVKTEGFNYVGTALALADAVALTGTVAWVHKALARMRARRTV